MITDKELEVLLGLAETGYNECPWAWPERSGFNYTSEEADEALEALRIAIRVRKGLLS